MSLSPRLLLIPLDTHNKQTIEELEPEDLDDNSIVLRPRISFNEDLLVCTFNPSQTVMAVHKSVLTLHSQPQYRWCNPILNESTRIISSPILKQSSPKTNFSGLSF
ncbi:hypothetical protein pb186bvf_002021 [Paramecium bursaria]